MPVLPAAGITFDVDTEITIVGAGACGLVAALAANDAGAQVIVLERDPVPQGSTAMRLLSSQRTRWRGSAAPCQTNGYRSLLAWSPRCLRRVCGLSPARPETRNRARRVFAPRIVLEQGVA